MALFKNMAITNKGMALYAKAQAGQQIHFTKMQVGSGQIDTQNPVTLLGLLNPKLDVTITSITANPELKSATIIGNVTNKNVKEAIYICEIGLFAKDPDEGEVLYGYASAGGYGDYYAPESQGPYSWQYEINAAIGNAANVTAELSQLQWDYGVMNSNINFIHLKGGNQKDINKSIDDAFKNVNSQLKETKENLESQMAEMATKQGDLNTLKTTDKTSVVNALNELFTNANNLKADWAGVIGNPLLETDTSAQLKSKTQTLKNTLANNLTTKGQSSSGSDTLNNLINKVSKINTGKKWATGSNDAITEGKIIVSNLSFKPSYIILYSSSTLSYQAVAAYTPKSSKILGGYGEFHDYGISGGGAIGRDITITNDGFIIESPGTILLSGLKTFMYICFE